MWINQYLWFHYQWCFILYIIYNKGAHKKHHNTNTTDYVSLHHLSHPQGIAGQLLQEPSIKDILDMTQLAKMTVVGIGAASNTATIYKYNIIKSNDLVLLKCREL